MVVVIDYTAMQEFLKRKYDKIKHFKDEKELEVSIHNLFINFEGFVQLHPGSRIQTYRGCHGPSTYGFLL